MKDRWKPLLWAAALGAAIGVRMTGANRSFAAFGRDSLDPAVREYWPFYMAGIAAFVLFGLYWEAAAKNAAAAARSESRFSRGVHVGLVSLGQLLILIPIRGLGRWVAAAPAIMAAGLAVEALGIFLAVWARQHLGRNWSGAIAIKVEHQLIRSGPYGRLRHPIYTGLLAMYLGMAVVAGDWLGLVGVAVIVFAYWRKIRLEEGALASAFGKDYEAYRAATWGLVPGIF